MIADLTDARILTALLDEGSFAAAARRLRLPTTTISRRVARMETRAGLVLFNRTSRVVRVTEAGRLAGDHARQILHENESAELRLEELRVTPAGEVVVSVPVIFGQALLAPAAAAFLARHPDCSLRVELSDRPVNLIEEAVDVVVRLGPPESEEIIVRPLGAVQAGLYAAPGTPMPASPSALEEAQIGLLHPGPGETPSLTLSHVDGRVVEVALTPRIVAMNPWLLAQMAEASDMIVPLPDVMAQPRVSTGQLRRILPEWRARRAPVHLAFVSRRFMRPAVRAFVDVAVEVLPDRLF